MSNCTHYQKNGYCAIVDGFPFEEQCKECIDFNEIKEELEELDLE